MVGGFFVSGFNFLVLVCLLLKIRLIFLFASSVFQCFVSSFYFFCDFLVQSLCRYFLWLLVFPIIGLLCNLYEHLMVLLLVFFRLVKRLGSIRFGSNRFSYFGELVCYVAIPFKLILVGWSTFANRTKGSNPVSNRFQTGSFYLVFTSWSFPFFDSYFRRWGCFCLYWAVLFLGRRLQDHSVLVTSFNQLSEQTNAWEVLPKNNFHIVSSKFQITTFTIMPGLLLASF